MPGIGEDKGEAGCGMRTLCSWAIGEGVHRRSGLPGGTRPAARRSSQGSDGSANIQGHIPMSAVQPGIGPYRPIDCVTIAITHGTQYIDVGSSADPHRPRYLRAAGTSCRRRWKEEMMDLQAGLGRTVGRRRRLQATATGKADSIMFTSLDIRVTKRRLLLVVALNVAGCTGDAGDGRSLIDRSNSSATADLEDLFSKSLHIGLEIQASSEAEAFANIVDAQLSPDGRFIVALDIVPPYVRVFDSTGVLQTAFVPGGEGPGEARDPVSLTVSNEQVLLVQPGRISWFDYSGELLAERSDLRFWPHSAARGCAGEFLLFGPGPTSTGEIVSLRSIRGPNDAPEQSSMTLARRELYTRRAKTTGWHR